MEKMYVFYLGQELFLLFIALMLFFDKNKKTAGFFLMFLMFSAICWIASLFFGLYFSYSSPGIASFLIRMAYGFATAVFYFLIGFFYFFPRKNFREFSFWKYFSFFTLFKIIIVILTPLFYKSVVPVYGDEFLVLDELGILYFLFPIYAISSMVATVFFVIRKRKFLSMLENKRMMFSFFGLLTAAVLILLFNGLLPVFGIYLLQAESPVFVLFFIFPALYATHQYQFFQLSLKMLDLIKRVFIVLVFLVTFFLSQALLESRIQNDLYLNLLVISLSLISIQLSLRFLPEFVARNFRDFSHRIDEFLVLMPEHNSQVSLKNLIDKKITLPLHLKFADLVYIREDKEKELGFLTTIQRSRFTKFIWRENKVLRVKELEKYILPDVILQNFEAVKNGVVMPIMYGSRLIGFFILGDKFHGGYERKEIEFLESRRLVFTITLVNFVLNNRDRRDLDSLQKVVDNQTRILRELTEKQAEFLSVAIHELRAPLGNSLRLLESVIHLSGLPDEQSEEVKEGYQSLLELQALQEQLFLSEQYGWDQIVLGKKRISPRDFVADVVKKMRPLASADEVELVLENNISADFRCRLDEVRIREVFQNIIKNALKYSPANSEIKVSTRPLGRKKIEVRISDQGPGIDKSVLPNIFQKFRGDKNSPKYGLGVGLFITRKIIELHGGEISAKNLSKPKSGAEFSFWLPV